MDAKVAVIYTMCHIHHIHHILFKDKGAVNLSGLESGSVTLYIYIYINGEKYCQGMELSKSRELSPYIQRDGMPKARCFCTPCHDYQMAMSRYVKLLIISLPFLIHHGRFENSLLAWEGVRCDV